MAKFYFSNVINTLNKEDQRNLLSFWEIDDDTEYYMEKMQELNFGAERIISEFEMQFRENDDISTPLGKWIIDNYKIQKDCSINDIFVITKHYS